MAVLKSLKQKDKNYIFSSYGNNKSDNPAVAVFNRFPLSDEVFPLANQKSIMESELIKNFDNSQKAKELLVQHIVNILIDNITANRINYLKFIEECVNHFENLIYEDKEIKTIKDFLTLPQEAVETIAKELYAYSKIQDEFTIEQKKILK
jgi:hypothetical protein